MIINVADHKDMALAIDSDAQGSVYCEGLHVQNTKTLSAFLFSTRYFGGFLCQRSDRPQSYADH